MAWFGSNGTRRDYNNRVQIHKITLTNEQPQTSSNLHKNFNHHFCDNQSTSIVFMENITPKNYYFLCDRKMVQQVQGWELSNLTSLLQADPGINIY